jgi:hypothetical protein
MDKRCKTIRKTTTLPSGYKSLIEHFTYMKNIIFIQWACYYNANLSNSESLDTL